MHVRVYIYIYSELLQAIFSHYVSAHTKISVYELCVTSSVMQMKSHLTPHLLLISWFLYLKQHLKVHGYYVYNDVGSDSFTTTMI